MSVYTEDNIEIKHDKRGTQYIEADEVVASDESQDLFDDLIALRKGELDTPSGDTGPKGTKPVIDDSRHEEGSL